MRHRRLRIVICSASIPVIFVSWTLPFFTTIDLFRKPPSPDTERRTSDKSWDYVGGWTDWQLDLDVLRNGPTVAGLDEPVERSRDEFSWFTDFYPGVPLKEVSTALEDSYWPNHVLLDSWSRDNPQPIPHLSATSQMYIGRLHWRDQEGVVYHFTMYLEIDGLIDAPREITFGELLCMAEADEAESLTLESCRVRFPYECRFNTSGQTGFCGDDACANAMFNY